LLLQVLFAALVPYLCVNLGWPDGRKVFMGDAGSTLIGFLMAWSLIYLSNQKVGVLAPVDTLWCVALPVMDTLAVMQRRVRLGRSPFKPDRQHLHHLVVDAGFPPRIALAMIVALGLGFGALGYLLRDVSELLSLAAFCVAFALYITHAPGSGVVKALCVLGASPDAAQLAPIAEAMSRDARFESRVCIATPSAEHPEHVLALFDLQPDVRVTLADDSGDDAQVT